MDMSARGAVSVPCEENPQPAKESGRLVRDRFGISFIIVNIGQTNSRFRFHGLRRAFFHHRQEGSDLKISEAVVHEHIEFPRG